jgi:putative ABC transport system substrate-binding protein
MRRREFIVGLGGVVAWPLAARAQRPLVPTIGFLHSGARTDLPQKFLTAFHRGLADTGYVEGRNVAIEYRWAEGRYDKLPVMAAELVHRQVAVIAVPASTVATVAAKTATQTIPIVFFIGADPIELGLVKSLNRPGGNVTGVTTVGVEVAVKRLELMHELVPAASLVGVLVNPANPVYTKAYERALEVGARVLGVRLLVLNASSQSEIDAAFATLVRERAGALVITGDTFFTTHQEHIVALALRYRVPTIEQTREFAEVGGLMSYATDYQEGYRLVGDSTGRILRGEKPADLPVQQATRIELIINLKTARAFGLTFPLTLLALADEVIE